MFSSCFLNYFILLSFVLNYILLETIKNFFKQQILDNHCNLSDIFYMLFYLYIYF